MIAAWLPRGIGRIGFVALALAGGLVTWRWLGDVPRSHHAVVADPVIGRKLALQLTTPLAGRDTAMPTASGGLSLSLERPHLVNLFASWCIPCRVEAPTLAGLARQGVRIDGIAVRDEPDAVKRFLKHSGDPFSRIALDPRGQVQSALGTAGLPETYVVDAHSIIIYRHRGALGQSDALRLAEHLH